MFIVCDEIKLPSVDNHRRQSVGLFPFLIPGSEKILYFFFGCRADGRPVLIARFAAVWATVGQRLCFKAVMADIAEIVVHSVLHFLCHVGVYISSGYFSIPR